MHNVFVTGATGQVGGAAVQALLARGVGVRAAVRDPAEASGLPDGAVPVRFDFRDSATWSEALGDARAVLLVRPPAIADVGPTLNAFIDLAAPRIEQVVFLSVAGADGNRFIPHAKVEAHLRAGQLPYTLLRAGFFAQNLCGPYRLDIAEDDRLYAPAGEALVSWVDTRDLGEAAAQALLTPEGQRAWLLTGREARSFREVAALLSAHLGRQIAYVRPWLPAFLWHLRRRRGLPWGAALVYTVLHTAVRLGAERRVDPTLEQVLGRPPRTIEDTIVDHLHLWSR